MTQRVTAFSLWFIRLYLQVILSKSHWSGSRSPHWDSSSISCSCPVLLRSFSFVLQSGSLHVFQQIIFGVKLRLTNLYNPNSGLGWLHGWPACDLSTFLMTRVSALALQTWVRDRDSSPAFMPSKSAFAHLYHQGQLYCVAQMRWRNEHSPECCMR